MKKYIIILILVPLIIFFVPGFAMAEESTLDEMITDMMSDIDTSMLNDYMEEYFDGLDADEIISEMTSGRFSSEDFSKIFSYIFSLITKAVQDNMPNFIMIFIIIVILSVMKHFSMSFLNTEITNTGFYAGNIIVCTIIASVAFNLVYSVSDTIAVLSEFISYISPILLPLLIALGGYSSSAVLTPAIAAFNSIVVTFFNYCIIPLIIICVVFAVVSSYSKNNMFSGFADFISSVVKWLMGIVFVVFLGIVMIQGTGAASFDGISIRTAKYTIDKTIPIVGGMFSDSMDTMIVCSSVIKNAIGITGLIITAGIILLPVIELLANILVFQAVGVFASPFASESGTSMFQAVSKILTLALVSVLIVGAMVFMLIAIIIGVGNINIMMR